MIAALPMYERPETVDAHDKFWTLIRDRLREAGMNAPVTLTRDADPWAVWQSPDLVLAQTCGLPYRARLQGRVALVGTPDYGLHGLTPGYYQSVVVLRADDPRQDLTDLKHATLAYNEALSQSGWAAPSALGLARGVHWTSLRQTGSHRASARAVADGAADLAALDAVTWRNLTRFEPDLTDRLRILTATTPTPGLPYITARTQDAPRIARAVSDAIAALPAGDRDLLGLTALVQIAHTDYLALPIPPGPGP